MLPRTDAWHRHSRQGNIGFPITLGWRTENLTLPAKQYVDQQGTVSFGTDEAEATFEIDIVEDSDWVSLARWCWHAGVLSGTVTELL